jgi:hypothetical protein
MNIKTRVPAICKMKLVPTWVPIEIRIACNDRWHDEIITLQQPLGQWLNQVAERERFPDRADDEQWERGQTQPTELLQPTHIVCKLLELLREW